MLTPLVWGLLENLTYAQTGQYHPIAESRVHMTWYQSHALNLICSIKERCWMMKGLLLEINIGSSPSLRHYFLHLCYNNVSSPLANIIQFYIFNIYIYIYSSLFLKVMTITWKAIHWQLKRRKKPYFSCDIISIYHKKKHEKKRRKKNPLRKYVRQKEKRLAFPNNIIQTKKSIKEENCRK